MAESSSEGLQLCPTRVDGAPALFAHKVSAAQCQERQRGHYHKCFTCAFNNAYVAKHGPPVEAQVPAAKPASASKAAEARGPAAVPVAVPAIKPAARAG